MSATKMIRFYRLIAAALLVLAFSVGAAAGADQQTFENPDMAARAFVDAVAKGNKEALASILGADWREFIPAEDIDQEDVDDFVQAWEKFHAIEPMDENSVRLAVGTGDWTLPIPVVKTGDGWRFDTQAGAEEMRVRRIGRNELSAMEAVLAYCDAQMEYALKDRNGDGVLEYARRLISSPGKRDGLYWPVEDGEEPSPLGPLFGGDEPGEDYHGYYYKILTGQGSNASDGAYDYLIDGRMVAGFGLVAWPVDYGESGVTTFIVSHDGQVYENDLENNTDEVARAMKLFDPDPDSGWDKTSPPISDVAERYRTNQEGKSMQQE